jgi:hypothetical protein
MKKLSFSLFAVLAIAVAVFSAFTSSPRFAQFTGILADDDNASGTSYVNTTVTPNVTFNETEVDVTSIVAAAPYNGSFSSFKSAVCDGTGVGSNICSVEVIADAVNSTGWGEYNP